MLPLASQRAPLVLQGARVEMVGHAHPSAQCGCSVRPQVPFSRQCLFCMASCAGRQDWVWVRELPASVCA
jgi:hypothetical protein